MPEAAENVELYNVVEDPNERRNLVRLSPQPSALGLTA